MIQSLTKRCSQLEEEVKSLKACAYLRSRNAVRRHLHQMNPPSILYSEWCKSFEVSFDSLQYTFQTQNTLLDGMKQCVQERILSEGLTNTPLRTFKEKQGTIYVYDKNEWHICLNDEWNKLIDSLAHSFIKTFCEWEEENEETIQSSMDKKDLFVQHMSKISRGIKDKEKHELKSWFIRQFQQSL